MSRFFRTTFIIVIFILVSPATVLAVTSSVSAVQERNAAQANIEGIEFDYNLGPGQGSLYLKFFDGDPSIGEPFGLRLVPSSLALDKTETANNAPYNVANFEVLGTIAGNLFKAGGIGNLTNGLIRYNDALGAARFQWSPDGGTTWNEFGGTITGGACPAGQFATGVNADGTPNCAAEIQNVIANAGLTRDTSNNFGLLSSCTLNQILKWNGTGWSCAADSDSDVWTAITGGIKYTGGNVGIGTTIADSDITFPLTVKGDVAAGGFVTAGTVSANSGIFTRGGNIVAQSVFSNNFKYVAGERTLNYATPRCNTSGTDGKLNCDISNALLDCGSGNYDIGTDPGAAPPICYDQYLSLESAPAKQAYALVSSETTGGWVTGNTGFGDTISIGGDSNLAVPDTEIRINAPENRNLVSFTNPSVAGGLADIRAKKGFFESLFISTGAVSGKVLTSDGAGNASWQAPVLSLAQVNVVTDIAARDALTEMSAGDVAIVQSENKTYIWSGSAWQEILSPNSVTSVNGETGTVSLSLPDIITCAASGQVLKWNNTTLSWGCDTDAGGIAGSGTSGKIAKWTAGGLGESVIMETSGGNVGVGIASPSAKFQIGNEVIASGSPLACPAGFVDVNGGSVAAGDVCQRADVSVSAGGSVGIGTPSPSFTLDVQGSAERPFRVKRTSAGDVGFQMTGTVQDAVVLKLMAANGDLQLGTNSTLPVITLANAGNVGIGTTDPAGYKLRVHNAIGSDTTNEFIKRASIFQLSGIDAEFSTVFDLTSDNGFILKNSGADTVAIKGRSVGIGTTFPWAALTVRGKPLESGGGTLHIGKANVSGDEGRTYLVSNAGWAKEGTSVRVVYKDNNNADATVNGVVIHIANGKIYLDPETQFTGNFTTGNDYSMTFASVTDIFNGRDASGTTRVTIDGKGNLLVGKNAVQTVFSSQGNIAADKDIFIGQNAYISGNVGIGTADPGAKLDVQGGAIKWASSFLSADQGGSIELGNTGTPYIDFRNDGTSDFDMRLRLTGDDSLAIEGGNVGIGTSPSRLFHIKENTAATDAEFQMQTQNKDAVVMTLDDTNGDVFFGTNSTADVLHLANGGNVGMSQNLTVAGNVTGNKYFRINDYDGDATFNRLFSRDGTLSISGNVFVGGDISAASGNIRVFRVVSLGCSVPQGMLTTHARCFTAQADSHTGSNHYKNCDGYHTLNTSAIECLNSFTGLRVK